MSVGRGGSSILERLLAAALAGKAPPEDPVMEPEDALRTLGPERKMDDQSERATDRRGQGPGERVIPECLGAACDQGLLRMAGVRASRPGSRSEATWRPTPRN